MISSRFAALLAAMTLMLTGVTAQAQNLFAPVATVDNKVVTQFELNQRIRFMELLRQPGNLEEAALDALINERLQRSAAERAGLRLSDEDIINGMAEFASRTGLSLEDFLKAIGGAGVEPESYRAFSHAGLVWRELVRSRFGSRAQVSDTEIDRALSRAGSNGTGGVRVNLAEIVIPMARPGAERIAEQLARTVRTERAFSQGARRYSASPSRGNGGSLGWIPLVNLPPQLRAIVLTLPPGRTTDPIPLPNAIALFQVRGIEEGAAVAPETLAIDYAVLRLASPTEVAAAAQRADSCDDLYGIARGLPEEQLLRTTDQIGAIPNDIALQLAALDDNEIATGLTRAGGSQHLLVMLCGRTAEFPEGARDQIRDALFNQRLDSFANGFLEELRADANISRK